MTSMDGAYSTSSITPVSKSGYMMQSHNMKRFWPVVILSAALILALSAVGVFSNQNEPDLSSAARARIEQARAAIVTIKTVDQSDQTTAQSRGFFIRKDLVATDGEVPDKNSRVVITAPDQRTIRVVSPGHYFLPYVLVEPQADFPMLKLGDSERVAVNDRVYMLDEAGKIVTGIITGFTTLNHTRTFSLSMPIDSNAKGAPIFNRDGEVIGMATRGSNGESAGLAWPSEVLAMMTHLNEPGVGVGAGSGRPFSREPSSTNANTSAASRVDTKPVRLSTPAARYTEAARANRVEGSVVLRVRVDEDGNVSGTSVVRGLPDGLTEQAIAAARASKFKPAMKDGKPVPYWVVLEISFSIR